MLTGKHIRVVIYLQDHKQRISFTLASYLTANIVTIYVN